MTLQTFLTTVKKFDKRLREQPVIIFRDSPMQVNKIGISRFPTNPPSTLAAPAWLIGSWKVVCQSAYLELRNEESSDGMNGHHNFFSKSLVFDLNRVWVQVGQRGQGGVTRKDRQNGLQPSGLDKAFQSLVEEDLCSLHHYNHVCTHIDVPEADVDGSDPRRRPKKNDLSVWVMSSEAPGQSFSS